MSKKHSAYVTTQVVAVENEKIHLANHISLQEQLESFARIIVDIYLETEHDKIDKQAE